MDLNEPTASPQCDESGAPVAEEQRYCVACGAHRRHVSDPAARYLSQASASSRTKRAVATGRRKPRQSSWMLGIGVAVVLAVIPAAATVGVLAGRSSNNDDASLIHALASREAADRAVAATGGGTAASASTAGTTGGTKGKGSATGHGKKSGRGGSGRGHAKGKRAKSSPTSTNATPLSTKAPSAAQKATGAKVTQKVQKSTGKSYVNGQSGLPGTVVVP